VGEPSRKYLWILSRTPNMEEATYQKVLKVVETLGYQPGKLQKTNQSVQANVSSPSVDGFDCYGCPPAKKATKL
jgi:uncharacterized protein YjaG (DUF416 family)